MKRDPNRIEPVPPVAPASEAVAVAVEAMRHRGRQLGNLILQGLGFDSYEVQRAREDHEQAGIALVHLRKSE